MRPDEHKQKRSAQYKKKHGIPKGGQISKSNKTDQDTEKNTRKSVSKSSKPTSASSTVTMPPSSLSKLESSSTDDESKSEAVCEIPNKRFQRRKLESNWDRYEGLDPNEEDFINQTGRGANFQTLLDTTATSLAGFRLKDECDWDTETSLEENSEYTSINCIDLSSAIYCVPLHQRLNIPAEIFQEEDLVSFIEEANFNKANYKASQTQHSTIESSNNAQNVKKQTHASFKDSQVGSDSPTDQLIGCLKGQTKAGKGAVSDQTISESNYDNAIKTVEERDIEKLNYCDKKTSGSINKLSDLANQHPYRGDNEDDEIDFLLSLEMPVTNNISSLAANQPSMDKRTTDDMVENDSHIRKTSVLQVSDSVQLKAKGAATIGRTSTDNLEDWLDSVLDD